mmetsp:Transcript_112559/g.317905  ORF Transcript_112559/g.317905 Transcript_112559/m.317905 type:complete len:244 (-) Transcript_112559:262-993(-)
MAAEVVPMEFATLGGEIDRVGALVTHCSASDDRVVHGKVVPRYRAPTPTVQNLQTTRAVLAGEAVDIHQAQARRGVAVLARKNDVIFVAIACLVPSSHGLPTARCYRLLGALALQIPHRDRRPSAAAEVATRAFRVTQGAASIAEHSARDVSCLFVRPANSTKPGVCKDLQEPMGSDTASLVKDLDVTLRLIHTVQRVSVERGAGQICRWHRHDDPDVCTRIRWKAFVLRNEQSPARCREDAI